MDAEPHQPPTMTRQCVRQIRPAALLHSWVVPRASDTLKGQGMGHWFSSGKNCILSVGRSIHCPDLPSVSIYNIYIYVCVCVRVKKTA